MYVNKYIDGHPYLCEAVEISSTGMLVRRVHEPDAPRAAYAFEMAPGPLSDGEARVWLCASSVWQNDELEAVSFVGQSERDRELVQALIARAAA